jgi:hypothetical protein
MYDKPKSTINGGIQTGKVKKAKRCVDLPSIVVYNVFIEISPERLVVSRNDMRGLLSPCCSPKLLTTICYGLIFDAREA